MAASAAAARYACVCAPASIGWYWLWNVRSSGPVEPATCMPWLLTMNAECSTCGVRVGLSARRACWNRRGGGDHVGHGTKRQLSVVSRCCMGERPVSSRHRTGMRIMVRATVIAGREKSDMREVWRARSHRGRLRATRADQRPKPCAGLRAVSQRHPRARHAVSGRTRAGSIQTRSHYRGAAATTKPRAAPRLCVGSGRAMRQCRALAPRERLPSRVSSLTTSQQGPHAPIDARGRC